MRDTIRIIIAGGPRTGKTTLAAKLANDLAIPHNLTTDSAMNLGWSEASAEAAKWIDWPAPWIIEGVATVRALRKWLGANPEGKPCDVLYFLETPHVDLTPGQISMGKGVMTVFREIYEELRERGVEMRGEELTAPPVDA